MYFFLPVLLSFFPIFFQLVYLALDFSYHLNSDNIGGRPLLGFLLAFLDAHLHLLDFALLGDILLVVLAQDPLIF